MAEMLEKTSRLQIVRGALCALALTTALACGQSSQDPIQSSGVGGEPGAALENGEGGGSQDPGEQVTNVAQVLPETETPNAGGAGTTVSSMGGSGGAMQAMGAAGAESDVYTEAPGIEGDGTVVVSPPYDLADELSDQGNPRGQEFSFVMPLADSAYYRGDESVLDPNSQINRQRRIVVYIPDSYVDGDAAPLLVLLDGAGRLGLVSYALDNLTRSTDPNRKLPAFVAIAVANGGGNSKGTLRGLELDTMSSHFAEFIYNEILPAVEADPAIRAAYPNFALTKNPWGRGVLGCSSGGAGALTMGWFRPDLFRRLITYSTTLFDNQHDKSPEEEQYPLGAAEYHSGQELIANSELKPLRIVTHVSENDNRGAERIRVMAKTAADLDKKGYHYRHLFTEATGHCDRGIFLKTLGDSLVWTWRGYHDD